MKILVTGAAGYIGSIITEQLVEYGYEVFALDNLKHGHREAVHTGAQFVEGDLLNGEWLKDLIKKIRIDAVVHLAAEALIDESIRDPGRFFLANVSGGLNLLEAMAIADVSKIIFSSTAAVYGQPERIPITEDATLKPVNSYGESKLAFERILYWYRLAYGLNYVSLRYFNACGATEKFGEYHIPETHLIPIAFEVALGEREAVRLFGTQYHTPDGSCIRDYIHVRDIAHAHILVLSQVEQLGAGVYNLGNGSGYSNLEVIETVRKVTGTEIPVLTADKRPGDPERLVASSDRIRTELGWQPKYTDLMSMIESAWAWRMKHPKGYSK